MAKGTKPGKTGRWMILLALILLIGFCYRYFVPWPYRGTIIQASQRNGVNPYLVAAVIRVESGFRPNVVSNRGAVGLMQIMPQTAQWIVGKTHQGSVTAKLLTKVEVNVGLGSWYLRHLLNVYHGNEVLALAAYNGGPNTVANWVNKGVLNPKHPNYRDIPYLETRNFVYRVQTYEHIYRIMYAWVNSTNTEAWGVVNVAKLMSEETKMKLGERIGVAQIVRQDGWGAVSSRDCGMLVKEAIRLAEEQMQRR